MPIDEKNDDTVGSFDDFFAEAIATTEDDGALDTANKPNESDEQVADTTVVTPSQDSNDQGALAADTEDYKAKYEQELQRTKSWDGRLSAKDREVAALRDELARTKQEQAAAKAEGADDADDASVTAFLEEFPELATPIQKMIERVTKRHGQAVADDMIAKVDRRIAPLAETMQETTVEKHLSTIRAAHSDFEAIVKGDDLQTWITEQPKYMQPSLREVYERGYAEDVVDMLTQYKTARNIGAVDAGPDGQVVEQKDTARRPSAAVRSRHTAPPVNRAKVAADDFDGGWAEAMMSKPR